MKSPFLVLQMLSQSNLKMIKERMQLRNKFNKKCYSLSTSLTRMWLKWVRCLRLQSPVLYSQINCWSKFKKNWDLPIWLSESISTMILKNRSFKAYFKHLSTTHKLYHHRLYNHKYYKPLFSNQHTMAFNRRRMLSSFKHHL